MGTSNDLQIAIRISAQIAQAEASLRAVQAQIAQLGATAQTASGAATGASAEIQAAVVGAASRMSTVQAAVAETAEQQTQRLRAMVQASLARVAADREAKASADSLAVATAASADAQSAAAAASMEQAAASEARTAAYATERVAIQQQMADIGMLDAIMEGTARSADDLALQEAALDRLMRANLISTTEYAAALDALNAVQAKYSIGEAEAAAATEAHAAAEGTLNSKLASGAAVREYSALLDEALRHNYSRMSGTLAVLSNRLGLMGALFSPLGLVIGGTVAALGGLAFAAYKGAQEAEKFDQAILSSGGALGVTRGEMLAMAHTMADGTTSIGHAEEALLAVANTGHYAGDQLELVARGARDLATVTGEKLAKATKAFTSLSHDPVKAAIQLNEQYHFLTQAVFDQIQALQQQGDTEQAAAIAQQALADAAHRRVLELQKDTNGFLRFLEGVGHLASAAWHRIFDPSTPESELQGLRAEIQRTEALLAQAKAQGGTVQVGLQIYTTADISAHLASVQAQERLLAVKVQTTQQAAREKAEQDRITEAYVKADAEIKDQLLDLDRQAQKQAEINRLNREFQQIAAAGALQQFGTTQDAQGHFHGGAYDKLYAAIEQKYAEHQQSMLDIDKQALAQLEAADHVSEAERGAFEVKFWQQKLAAAKAGTQQYAQIYAIVSRLQAEQDRAAEAARQQQAERSRQLVETEIASAQSARLAGLELERQAIEQQRALGELSAREEIARLQALEERKYQIELAAYQAKLKLEQGNPVATAQIYNQIQQLTQQHTLQMSALNNQMVIDTQQQWERILSPFSQAFDQSIKGIIRGTTTVRNAMRDLAQNVVLEFVDMGVQALTHWIATQIALTTVTAAGESRRLAIQQTADKQSLLSTAMTATKTILMKVWQVMAEVYAAIAGIPYVGPFLAPAMAVAAGATVASWAGRVASAAGGWVVPRDQLAMVHEREMILPRHISEGLQGMIAAGAGHGASGDIHLHVHTMDAAGVREFMRRNQFELAEALRMAHRNGAFAC